MQMMFSRFGPLCREGLGRIRYTASDRGTLVQKVHSQCAPAMVSWHNKKGHKHHNACGPLNCNLYRSYLTWRTQEA